MEKPGNYYKDIVCLISQYNKYLVNENKQYNKSKSFIMKSSAKGNVDQKKLQKWEKIIDKSYAEKIKQQKLIEKMIKNKLKSIKGSIKNFKAK